MTRTQLIAALVTVQNHPHFNHQDIMTITGFMTDKEVQQHLDSCKRRTGEG